MGYERNKEVDSMNAIEMAEMLNNREIGNETTQEIEMLAKDNDLVIVFGASDDLMEFRGAINEEFDSYLGTSVQVNENGLIENKCEDENCPYYAETIKGAPTITSIWASKHVDIAWTYKTYIPCETFNIVEDDGIYCTGIVFSLKDLKS